MVQKVTSLAISVHDGERNVEELSKNQKMNALRWVLLHDVWQQNSYIAIYKCFGMNLLKLAKPKIEVIVYCRVYWSIGVSPYSKTGYTSWNVYFQAHYILPFSRVPELGQVRLITSATSSSSTPWWPGPSFSTKTIRSSLVGKISGNTRYYLFTSFRIPLSM